MDENSSEFSCPICFEIPLAEIYQCTNGHTVCQDCSSNISVCPLCQVKYGPTKIRCRALEMVLDKLKFSCTNQNLGCQFKAFRTELFNHQKVCLFREIEMDLCQNLGYECSFIVSSSSTVYVSEHFQQVHGAKVANSSTSGIFLLDFKNAKLNLSKKWAPLFVEDFVDGKRVEFMTLANINGCDETFSLVTMFMDFSQKLYDKFHVKYTILRESTQGSNMVWVTTVANLVYAKETADFPLIRIPGNILKANYAVKDYLKVVVQVVQSQGQIPNLYVCVEHSIPANSVGSGQSNYISPDISCDECKVNPISGPYHHCLQCQDYDLCSKCKKRGVHSFHLFNTIENDMQYAAMHKLHFDKVENKWRSLLTADVVVEQANCTECSKLGIQTLAKVFCSVCPKMYGLCKSCCVNKRQRKTCLEHGFRIINKYA